MSNRMRNARPAHTQPRTRLAVELLEDRLVPAADAILDWNAVALEAHRIDHTPGVLPGSGAFSQGGPTRAARALAIIHVAMFDALNSISKKFTPYQVQFNGYGDASKGAAVATAAYVTLVDLFPSQEPSLTQVYNAYLAGIPNGSAESQGVELGELVGEAILAARVDDGSDDPMPYTPVDEPGHHQPDPFHPDQGFLTPGWGDVTPFSISSSDAFLSPPPPALNSLQYTAAFYEVALLGGDGVTTPTIRTPEQTIIGIYWGYDGAPGLGTPPRLYNQIVRVIADNQDNTMLENARLFALVNLAMADAGIQSWDTKYTYDFWRPVVALREGGSDGNPLTIGLPNWAPLGAPATNVTTGNLPRNFTPNFPAYTSGHATFGAATFRSVARFYGTDRVPFSFVSEEFNGINRDQNGNVRPLVTRHFKRLSQAAEENGQSRIYLGIHWSFDKTRGIQAGNAIADWVFNHELRPVGRQRSAPRQSSGDVATTLAKEGTAPVVYAALPQLSRRAVNRLVEAAAPLVQGDQPAATPTKSAAKVAASALADLFAAWDTRW